MHHRRGGGGGGTINGMPSIDHLPVAGGPRKPRADAVALFREFEGWLMRVRPGMGRNSNISASNPRETHTGITCDITNSSGLDADFFSALCSFAPGCKAGSQRDDASDTECVYVHIPWPFELDPYMQAEAARRQAASSTTCLGWFSRLADRPKVVFSALVITCLSASYTTNWVQWRTVLSAILGAA